MPPVLATKPSKEKPDPVKEFTLQDIDAMWFEKTTVNLYDALRALPLAKVLEMAARLPPKTYL